METMPEDELNKKPHAVMAALDEVSPATGRRLSSLRRNLPQLALQLEPVGVDNVASLNMGDLDNLSPLQSQVSPTGLISIAAADIDEAQSQPQPSVNAELDWKYIEALRNSVALPRDRRCVDRNVCRRRCFGSALSCLVAWPKMCCDSSCIRRPTPRALQRSMRRRTSAASSRYCVASMSSARSRSR